MKSFKLKKRLYFSILSICIAICICFSILWQIGYISIWSKGISYYENELKKYSYQSSIIDNAYSIEIDLNDLESNIGKILYQDKNCTIDVYEVTDSVVWFRSHGTYTFRTATLVSGIKHSSPNICSTTDYTASITTEYNGEVYVGDISGRSSFKDGDMFGFHLIGAYNQNHGNVKLKGIVTVTITNLCLNTWILSTATSATVSVYNFYNPLTDDVGLKNLEETGIKNTINQSVTSNEITINLEEIITDNTQTLIKFHIPVDTRYESGLKTNNIYISDKDGRVLSNDKGGFTKSDSNQIYIYKFAGGPADDTELYIKIDQLLVKGNEIVGSWIFEKVPIIINKAKILNINKSYEIGEYSVNIKSVTTSLSMIKVKLSMPPDWDFLIRNIYLSDGNKKIWEHKKYGSDYDNIEIDFKPESLDYNNLELLIEVCDTPNSDGSPIRGDENTEYSKYRFPLN